MKRKLLAVLAVVAVFGLAGCQNEVNTYETEITATVVPKKEAATTAPTEGQTAEPTEAVESTVTPEPTKEAEKSADKNGCSDVITAVDYTSDQGMIVSYDFFGNIREVQAYIHKNGLKFYEGGESHYAVFGSSLYNKYGDIDSENTGKYFISYELNQSVDWYWTVEELEKAPNWGPYEFNGIKIAYQIVSEDSGYGEELNYIEYMFAQDIGLSSFILIDVKSYDLTESMDDVLARVLLLEGDYTLEASTSEPTKEPEKVVENNGCSDIITAVDYTSDQGMIARYNWDTDTMEVLVYLHKNGLKFYKGGESYYAVFGSSLYGDCGSRDVENPYKYSIYYNNDVSTNSSSFEDLRDNLVDRIKYEDNSSAGIYEFNGTKIAYSRIQYEEFDMDGYMPAYMEYRFYQDIGLGEYIRIEVTSYDITEDMDTVLGRVLLLEGDYTINQ